ncbi:hypothetical protein BFP70_05140 [Thioclava sp. SK-1]|nr:hypothetical protein BFP70_05140 [Thioclava sp. SK-1]
MTGIRNAFRGDSTRAASLRSSALVAIGFGGQNVLRLVSNLILTRILFPEAFGLMGLVYVFISGVTMFSDLGINTSIMQNKRGEEPDFLNTAWTVQILRGFLLWVVLLILAYPTAQIYDEPRLIWLLPSAGLIAIVQGFRTTKVAVANRNMKIGVQVMSELSAQTIGMLCTVVLAMIWPDVWTLVVGALIAPVINNIVLHIRLPGPRNRLHWDRSAVSELIHFGKFIFLSSIAGFIVNQSDRAVLGAYIPVRDLGIYMIAYTVASIPLLLVHAAASKILLPIYRKFPMHESQGNRAKVLRARRLMRAASMSLVFVFSAFGVALISWMYDARYAMAGPMVIFMGLSMAAQIATSLYDGCYLSQGDSNSHFRLVGLGAVLQLIFLLVGVHYFGTLGAILAPCLTAICQYPYQARLVNRYHAWDPLGDALSFLLGVTGVALGAWMWRDAVGVFLASTFGAG